MHPSVFTELTNPRLPPSSILQPISAFVFFFFFTRSIGAIEKSPFFTLVTRETGIRDGILVTHVEKTQSGYEIRLFFS